MAHIMKTCLNCSSEISINRKYCSAICQRDFEYKQFVLSWRNGSNTRGKYFISHYIRRYLFEKSNNSCYICGWNTTNPYTGKIPLEVHHKDGDCTNCNEDNLELLCPNCHSLTSTFKNYNKGNGRDKRKTEVV